MSNNNRIQCYMCGACCIAYEISSLGKPSGIKCVHLEKDGKCGNYEDRPYVCRAFLPDEICVLISTLSLEEKVEVIQRIYGIK